MCEVKEEFLRRYRCTGWYLCSLWYDDNTIARIPIFVVNFRAGQEGFDGHITADLRVLIQYCAFDMAVFTNTHGQSLAFTLAAVIIRSHDNGIFDTAAL